MTNLRRGFKKEASAIARQVRADLGLDVSAPLDVWKLAEDLGIPLIPLSKFAPVASDGVNHFMRVETGAFSAMTVFCGDRRCVVYNDGHSQARQASDIAHELAHALLLHPPRVALSVEGCRNWSDAFEEEAEWLGGTLLIPEEAALTIVKQQLAADSAARRYGVSRDMLRYRLNVTAAKRRISASPSR